MHLFILLQSYIIDVYCAKYSLIKIKEWVDFI